MLDQSYRQITPYVDYKILTTILAKHLNKILDKYILQDQVGFVKGRRLKDCTQRISNVKDLFFLQRGNTPALLYFSDAEKAFDRVHWGFV